VSEQTSEKISIGRQINAVELCFIMVESMFNDAAAKQHWPDEDLEQKRVRMREIKAAVNTLTWIENNREAVIAAHKSTKG
jgi:hypothetical protein